MKEKTNLIKIMSKETKKTLILILVVSLLVIAFSTCYFGYKNYRLNKMQTEIMAIDFVNDLSSSNQELVIEKIDRDKTKELFEDIINLFK